MSKSHRTVAWFPPARQDSGPEKGRPRLREFLLATLALVAVFSQPLFNLARFAAGSDLYSHILLIPFVSCCLIWMKRRTLPPPSGPDLIAVFPLVLAGLAALAGWWAVNSAAAELAREDSLALTVFPFVLCFWGICILLLGRRLVRAIAFPLGFLLFMVPLPVFLTNLVEIFLQHVSAVAAVGFFKVAGTPLLLNDLIIHLPGVTLAVAPECSGIHSTLALFITSVLAGYWFLRSPWKRAAFALAVIPLGVLRNGFRIFTIGELCVRVGPEMIDSYIHRQGGPIFFALSLVPLGLLLVLLRRSDRFVGENGSGAPACSTPGPIGSFAPAARPFGDKASAHGNKNIKPQMKGRT